MRKRELVLTNSPKNNTVEVFDKVKLPVSGEDAYGPVATFYHADKDGQALAELFMDAYGDIVEFEGE